MKVNAEIEVWEGMRYRELALRMSHLQEPHDDHLERMLRDKEWVDASVIHALACEVRVDVAIWQAHKEPCLLGHSLLKKSSAALGLVAIALNNDHHFWGVVERPISHQVIEIEDRAGLLRDSSDRNGSCDNEDDDDEAMTVPMVLDMAPDVMSVPEVHAELQLFACLSSWAPWEAPNDLVIDRQADIKRQATARHCMLRQPVVTDLIWETATADK